MSNNDNDTKKIKLNIIFRQINTNDISEIYDIESKSYPEDEAASLSSIQFRTANAHKYFLIATTTTSKGEEIIGYVNGTRCNEFTHESMSDHDSSGKYLAIHSVVIKQEYRKQGYGTSMLKEYLQRVKHQNGLQKVVLLSKSHNLLFYINVGFMVIGKSPIVHGCETWYDCQYNLNSSSLFEGNELECFMIDAFAIPNRFNTNNDSRSINDRNRRRSGNPAAVVLMRGNIDEDNEVWKQEVSKEFNLSETAFLWRHGNENSWDIRYYTNTGVQVDLCGHATLASTAALAYDKKKNLMDVSDIVTTFHTKKGIVSAMVLKDVEEEDGIWIRMDLPWNSLTSIPKDNAEYSHIVSMLSLSLRIFESDILYLGTSQNSEDIHVEIAPSKFHALNDNYNTTIDYNTMSLDTLPYKRGLCISCRNTTSDAEIDFYSRFFGPKVGILEDPVTGSAHAFLGPYYGNIFNKKKVIGKQVSKKGGILYCILEEEKGVVCLDGFAKFFMRGYLES